MDRRPFASRQIIEKSETNSLLLSFKDVVIDKFQVYNNGLLCEAAAYNQQCAEFLDEVLDLAPAHFNVPVTKRMKAFQSKFNEGHSRNFCKIR
jgi:hypothetical protein